MLEYLVTSYLITLSILRWILPFKHKIDEHTRLELVLISVGNYSDMAELFSYVDEDEILVNFEIVLIILSMSFCSSNICFIII